jgi:L-threonylcarbamoyladenylate synthase
MSGNSIHVRPCEASDAAAVADAFLVSRARCLPFLPKVHEDRDVRRWVADVLCRRPEVWVAELDGRVVGFAALREEHLDHLYVHPDYHGRGAGSALLREALRHRPNGVLAWVFQQNAPARRFYERHGFLLVRETDGSGNEERTPDALYAWSPEGEATVLPLPPREEVRRAADILKRGGLVAFPTETVYGLGADATNPRAVQRIFEVKGRPSTNPLIVHVADETVARRYARDWPLAASRVAERFWPGPLTIVVPKHPSIVDEVTAGLDTVGLRAPDHPLALELLREFDGPLAGPSANKSSHVSPTTAQHVRDELGDAVDLILDGGPCEVGIESTVLDLVSASPRILRPGAVTREEIEDVIGPVEMKNVVTEVTTPADAPGQHERHYAPRTPALRVEPHEVPRLDLTDAAVLDLTLDPDTYARNFYARLRMLDAQNLRAIYIVMPPDTPEWFAMRDRITRATRPLSGR